jgi:protease I
MDLNGKKVAVLVDHGFEEIEMTDPVKALKEAGAEVMLISPESKVKSWNHKEWGKEYKADVLLNKAEPFGYDALLLPGGVMNPDRLIMKPEAISFIRHFLESGKPLAAICHGAWTLIETNLIKGRTMTSYPSIKTDLINAGVNWVDQEVLTDNGIVTSRKPDEIPAFNKKMIEEFAEGIHHKRKKELEKKESFRSPVKGTEREIQGGTLRENIDPRNWDEANRYRDTNEEF